MTTTFIISYIVLALIIVGVINLLLIRSRRKAKRQQKEQHFATRQSNQSKFKASDLDRTTDQSSQHTAREEARIDNKDNQNQVSLNKQTEGSEQDKASIKGKVDSIGKATAASFSLMPSSNSDGNYTKVSQVIPVKITLESEPSKQVVPGMNAEVKIHKN
ncbi:drug resistance transporter [Staphylococcus aureus]|nr:drug resistance transporter [Staphylococcus aureus]